MKRNQKGFSFIEVMLVLIFVTLISFIGWYVWHSNRKTNSSSNGVSQNASSQVINSSSDLLTFSEPKDPTTNFRYPKSWKLSDYTDGVDMGDGNKNVILTGPSGSKVILTSTGAGIGGDCMQSEHSKVTYSKKISGAKNLYIVDWELFDGNSSLASGIDVLNANQPTAFTELGDHEGCVTSTFAFSSTKYETSGYWFGTNHSGQSPKSQDVAEIHQILESLKVQ